MYDFSADRINWLACVGLLWDLAGAYFLAKALVFSKDHLIRRQSGTYMDFSLPLLKAQVEQRIDARYGLSQLASGFIMQFASSFGLSCSPLDAILLLAPILLVWMSYCRDYHRTVLEDSMRITAVGINKVEVLADLDTWVSFYDDMSREEIIAARRFVLRRHGAESLMSASKGFCKRAADDPSFDFEKAAAREAPKKAAVFHTIDGGDRLLREIAEDVVEWSRRTYGDDTSRGVLAARALSAGYILRPGGNAPNAQSQHHV